MHRDGATGMRDATNRGPTMRMTILTVLGLLALAACHRTNATTSTTETRSAELERSGATPVMPAPTAVETPDQAAVHPREANDNVRSLMEELTGTENKVGFARQFYNDIATKFNTAQQVFPTNIFAASFGFKTAELFEITEAADREVPTVDLGRR